jgi:hypothetical protein
MAETTVLKSSASPKVPKPASANAEATLSGALPVVNVSMGSGGKPAVASAGQMVKQGVVILPPKNQRRHGVVIGPIGGGGSSTETLVSALSADQLLLCRHAIAAYVTAQGEGAPTVTLAKETIKAIDDEITRGMERAARVLPPMIAASPGARGTNVGAPRGILPRGPLPPVVVDLRETEGNASVPQQAAPRVPFDPKVPTPMPDIDAESIEIDPDGAA